MAHRYRGLTQFMRRGILRGLLRVRSSRLRRPVTAGLVWLHNWSYHLIALMASHGGQHPKHAIQQYHRFFVDHVASTDRVLDVGCGHGDVTYDVVQKAAYAVGIDISAANIARARYQYQHPRLSFIEGDATTMELPGSFDVIILSNVLEHIADRVSFLRRLSDIAPRLLIRVPMLTRDWITVYKKQEGFEYRLDDTHEIEYEEATFADEMAAAGLTINDQYVSFGELYAVVTRQPVTAVVRDDDLLRQTA